MSWRIVSVSSMSKLDYKLDYLVVRRRDETTRIHLSEISILILESTAISFTAYLLRELECRKIDVIFCDEKRTPYGMLASLYGSHDTALRYREQAAWPEERQALIWSILVRQKLLGQIAVLPPDRMREKEYSTVSRHSLTRRSSPLSIAPSFTRSWSCCSSSLFSSVRRLRKNRSRS